MEVFASRTAAIPNIGAILSSHKAKLGNKYAFLFNKDAISRAKNNNFPKPPRRTNTEGLDLKLEEEMSTSDSSGDSSDQIVRDDQVKVTIALAAEEQSATTKRLLEDILALEEHLCSEGIVKGDALREIRKFGHFLIANILSRPQEFHSMPKEGICLGVLLLIAEKFEIDQKSMFKLIEKEYKLRRISRMGQIRHTKAYALLSPLVDSFESAPSSP